MNWAKAALLLGHLVVVLDADHRHVCGVDDEPAASEDGVVGRLAVGERDEDTGGIGLEDTGNAMGFEYVSGNLRLHFDWRTHGTPSGFSYGNNCDCGTNESGRDRELGHVCERVVGLPGSERTLATLARIVRSSKAAPSAR